MEHESPVGAGTVDSAVLLESRLVAAARQGDVRAFETLVGEHSPRLQRTLRHIVGSAEDAEEVLQEALLKAWRGLPGFRAEARFSTWLYRIAMNEANRRLARNARRASLPIDDVMLELPDLTDGPAALAEANELEEHLQQCIAALPVQYRAAVVLRDVQGLSNEEAASVLELELRNFKSRLHRGRMAIRQMVEERYSSTP